MPSQAPFRWGPFSVSVADEPDYVLEIEGNLISKKNRYKIGKRGMYKGHDIVSCERMVSMQIPVFMRSLKLESPSLLIERRMPKFNRDRDNGYTFLLDCLVNNGVLKNDSTASFNGTEIHIPVERGEKPMTRLYIWKNKEIK